MTKTIGQRLSVHTQLHGVYLQGLQNQNSEQDTRCLQAGGRIILGKDAPGSVHPDGEDEAAKTTWQGETLSKYPGTRVAEPLKRCSANNL